MLRSRLWLLVRWRPIALAHLWCAKTLSIEKFTHVTMRDTASSYRVDLKVGRSFQEPQLKHTDLMAQSQVFQLEVNS